MPFTKGVSAPTQLEIAIEGKLLEVEHHLLSDDSRTIVLLHEALGSVSHWKDFPARLASRTNHNVLVYSRAGHGNSSGPPERRTVKYFKRQAQMVLLGLLQQLNISSPVLFGHSEGAAIAALLAASHPALPSAVILESPILTIEPVTVAGLKSAVHSYNVTDFRSRLGRHHRDLDSVFRSWTEPWMEQQVGEFDSQATLRAIRCRVCGIQGDRDEFATTKQMTILAEAVPNAQVFVINDCGHTPHREKPDEVLDCVANFLLGSGG